MTRDAARLCGFLVAVVLVPTAHAQLACTFTGYKPTVGLTAAVEDESLAVQWEGEPGEQIRMRLGIQEGTPTVIELAISAKGGSWATLLRNAKPVFRVVTGYRRLDQEAYPALKVSVGTVTQAVLDRYKWFAFWDAPLHVPGAEPGPEHAAPPPEGIPGTNQPRLPRSPEEIKRASAIYTAKDCDVNTNGNRLEISFPGVELGLFAGRLQFTVYKGTSLVRLEVIARTSAESVAYKYDAGLQGLTAQPGAEIVWRDITNMRQSYEFADDSNASDVNESPAVVRAANRLIAAQVHGGAISAFPPPHNFFWTRELSVNLGYNWYRKDSSQTFSFGIRQSESEAEQAWAGRGAGDFSQNFALYNARPGTWQHMPVFFVVGSGTADTVMNSTLRYTRNDHYKAIPGYWIMSTHYHNHPVSRLLGGGSLDNELPDYELARATGINIFGEIGETYYARKALTKDTVTDSEVKEFSEAVETGRVLPEPLIRKFQAIRLKGQELYYKVARLHSRKDFLVMPNEEIYTDVRFGGLGGHNDVLVSHPVFWTNGEEHVTGQALVENDTHYGKVYHIGTPRDLMEMVHREQMLIFMPHPDTKNSAGYPAAFKDSFFFRDPQYRGIGFRWGMGVDRSESRLSDYRCMPLFDEMNNWVANLTTPPKYMHAITETYEIGPGDDFYANNPVSYVKVHGKPHLDDWRPITDAMMSGDFFVTSGEVLIPSYRVEGTGSHRTIVAEVEWTFPLDYLEVVWGDGDHTDRQIFSGTSLAAFGKKTFRLPFDAAGKKWVRFAVWDAAGNGAFVQPIHLTAGEPAS